MTDSKRAKDEELHCELDRWYRHNWWMGLRAAVAQRGREHDNYFWAIEVGTRTLSYRWLARHFYTLKAVVCLLLRRHGGPDIDVDAVDGIAIWDETGPWGEYSAYSWECLEVGHGIFRNWHCQLGHDGSA